VVEGPKAFGERDDGSSGSCRVGENFFRGDAQNVPSVARQHRVPFVVALWPIAHVMGQAIDFDEQSDLQSGEVRDVPAYGKLLAKLHAAGLAAQLAPQQNFRQRHLPAELSRILDVRLIGPHRPVACTS
jgi:hypothetical protein